MEEEDDEELTYELIKPKKRIGRPPREWSSILLPKEVTNTFGVRKSTGKSHKQKNHSTRSSNYNDQMGSRVDNNPKLSTNMVGQAVHGVVDSSFDAGFLVSLRMGESEAIYRGVVFGPGLSIPLSKDTDTSKNVKRRRRRRTTTTTTTTTIREEPSTNPPPTTISTTRDEHSSNPSTNPPPTISTIRDEPSTNPTLTHQPPPPPIYGASLAHQQGIVQARDTPHINTTIPPPNANQFGYNGVFNPNNLRPLPHQPEINVNPFLHSHSFTHRPNVPLPTQGYNPRQNFGHILPTPSTQFGYTFGAAQGRPTTPLHSHYEGP